MAGKIIKMGLESQSKIIEGVNETVDAIKVTLGPSGKSVAISNSGVGGMDPEITRDGATVAKSISFSDEAKNIGARLVLKAASLTEEQSGDGTSSVSVLTQELCKKGQKAIKSGVNVNEMKSGMLKVGKWMTKYIKSNAISIDGDLEKIRKVATISANNDPEVGNNIVECMEKVGPNGVITADLSPELDTVIDVTTGMKLDRGWASPQYVTSAEEGKCIMDDPYIVTIGQKLSSVNQILPLMQQIMPTGRPVLLIVDDMDEVVNSTIVINVLQGALRACIVRGVDFGDNRKNVMQDIAFATGGIYITPENGLDIMNVTLEHLGAAKKVIVSRDSTIIFNGAGKQEDIEGRVEILKNLLKTASKYDQTKIEKRIANLAGGIGIIRAGGATEAEKLNRKATIEDAILASKSAIAEGCVPGSGYIYLRGSIEITKDKSFWKSLEGDEVEGANVVISSLPIIMETVADNAGFPGVCIKEAVSLRKTNDNWGFNAKTRKYCNLVESGILDSAKVLRVALENAISTASMVLLTNCVVTNEPEDKGLKL